MCYFVWSTEDYGVAPVDYGPQSGQMQENGLAWPYCRTSIHKRVGACNGVRYECKYLDHTSQRKNNKASTFALEHSWHEGNTGRGQWALFKCVCCREHAERAEQAEQHPPTPFHLHLETVLSSFPAMQHCPLPCTATWAVWTAATTAPRAQVALASRQRGLLAEVAGRDGWM